MRVFYDWASKEWSSHTGATLGSNLLPLKSPDPETEHRSLSFSLSGKNQNAGPVIGILTSKGKDNTLAGNGPLFKALQEEVLQNKGISFVFTTEDIEKNSVNGYIYLPDQDKWIKACCPLPHLVYNRVPFRKHEQTDSYNEACNFFKKHNIPFFNPGFLDKYEVCQLFMDHPHLQKYIPDTILVTDESVLKNFIGKFRDIYLKPAQGAKGKGIYRLSHSGGKKLIISGLKDSFSYKCFESFWNEWKVTLTGKAYLAQKSIISAQLDGKRFDFRILAHFSRGEYQVTGIGIRQAQDQEITTHIPNGGIMIPYEKVRTKEHDEFINMAVSEAGKLLKKEIGFYREFSMDAGLSEKGKYFIYELNAKPMSFDEASIESKRVQELTRIFFNMAGF
ncbi:YheC/YheD family protein [Bacillus sp. ISL-47]|uniref:YheC/YheD family endospore coat-associated protein n=1 Tax=Bacillus sp. ISL-47 TaxID=2819130 RepID=UPI001BE73E06|nr:YheC/YheD family protein [Bacillus sp. ISL-47]MBT2691111.1 YheC/YheD family protein [Bacillus sp. ISL-47]MBT2711018.1 YheC/YheD family protein [Pseudomonas sp. ISL-84]